MSVLHKTIACGFVITMVSACAQNGPIKNISDPYFSDAQIILQNNINHTPNKKPARNVILFIGDGMGVSTVTAIRILEGQLKGGNGEENILPWERFPYTALSKTYNINQQIPDSAGTASAIMSGTKTKAGFISINQTVARGDCEASKGNHLESILELSEKAGLNSGIITTATLTHATPAAAYAHSPERSWEYDDRMPLEAVKQGCTDIAQQFVDFSIGNGIEVAFGGGRAYFLPEEKGGKRKDGQDLIEEWKSRHKNGQYISNTKGLNELNLNSDGPVLGLFSPSYMAFEATRPQDEDGEPSLADMTRTALKSLQKKQDGYFLYVEAGRIDHAHHAGNAYRALHDGVALAEAVRAARQMTNNDDTLIIVTADHSHGFVMTGYATRGNPILGKLRENDKQGNPDPENALGLDGMPYTTLGYYNGPGAENDKTRADLTNVDTEALNFRQQALVPRKSETHGGEDVAIYAAGPGAYLFQGVVEENYIFHVMKHALRLDGKLKK